MLSWYIFQDKETNTSTLLITKLQFYLDFNNFSNNAFFSSMLILYRLLSTSNITVLPVNITKLLGLVCLRIILSCTCISIIVWINMYAKFYILLLQFLVLCTAVQKYEISMTSVFVLCLSVSI